MFNFPENLYTDVRIETVSKTTILYQNSELAQNKTSVENGAMIRVFDGVRWYYGSTTDIVNIQKEIDKLAAMAVPNQLINEDKVVQRMEVHNEVNLNYQGKEVIHVSDDDKLALLEDYLPLCKEVPQIQVSKLYYIDNYTKKHFISSKGSDITFDTQHACVALRYTMFVNDLPYNGRSTVYKMSFDELRGHEDEIRKTMQKDIDYASNAVLVVPGSYTCILSPPVAGVFAHESFGHKSEADFMIGDESMLKEWAIGSKVGAPILNIIDTGNIEGSGYVPYDDEGCIAKEIYLIKDGILTGRLHSAYTAAALDETPTGNARAKNFEFEPIVRMTCTYIGAGSKTKEELFAGVEEGIYIDDLIHGSGMSTFTIAPQRAYMIRNGKLAEPVKISVITGNVMETLNEIDGLSDTVEFEWSALGGCGKMEQYPLRVGYGGPYVRVNKIKVN